jgi:hypothetical protein
MFHRITFLRQEWTRLIIRPMQIGLLIRMNISNNAIFHNLTASLKIVGCIEMAYDVAQCQVRVNRGLGFDKTGRDFLYQLSHC